MAQDQDSAPKQYKAALAPASFDNLFTRHSMAVMGQKAVNGPVVPPTSPVDPPATGGITRDAASPGQPAANDDSAAFPLNWYMATSTLPALAANDGSLPGAAAQTLAEKEHVIGKVEAVAAGDISLADIPDHQKRAMSAADLAEAEAAEALKKRKPPIVEEEDEEEDPEKNKHHLLGEAALATGVVAAATRVFHHHKHRLRRLIRLIRGKRHYVRLRDKKGMHAAGRKKLEAERILREAKARSAAAEADVARAHGAADHARMHGTDSGAADVARAEHELMEARNLESRSVRLAEKAKRELAAVSKFTRIAKRARGGPIGGLIMGAIGLPVLGAIAWVKTAKAGTSNQDLQRGAVKAAVNTFSFLNKDAIAALKKGDYKGAADEYFGISDTVRLAKLAKDDPEAFKKEMSEMGEGAERLMVWAQKNPEKFNQYVLDSDAAMKDEEFLTALGATVHEGLDGDREGAALSGLQALSRGQDLDRGNGVQTRAPRPTSPPKDEGTLPPSAPTTPSGRRSMTELTDPTPVRHDPPGTTSAEMHLAPTDS